MPCRSDLLSAAANNTHEEDLRFQGSRLLASFNESMTLSIPLASGDDCKRAPPHGTLVQWYKKWVFLSYMQEALCMRTATQSHSVKVRLY